MACRIFGASVAVLLLAACCLQVVSAADEAPKTGAADSSTTTTKPQQPAAANLHPKNIEEEYYNVPVRSVLGEGPHETPSTGKALNQLGEFDIVYEGPGDATGDLNLTTPLFTASYTATVSAVSGIRPSGDGLEVDGPHGMWSLDAEQRFFWNPVANEKPHVTIVGRADFPEKIVIRGKWGGASPLVATLGRIGTRGSMPRSFPVNIPAPQVCSYTWTTPDSGCNNVFLGKFSSEPSFEIRTNIGGFAYASLYQDSLMFNKYAEITCVIDPKSAKVEPCGPDGPLLVPPPGMMMRPDGPVVPPRGPAPEPEQRPLQRRRRHH